VIVANSHGNQTGSDNSRYADASPYDKVKTKEMGCACSTHGTGEKCVLEGKGLVTFLFV
jgi:hypothetical protein